MKLIHTRCEWERKNSYVLMVDKDDVDVLKKVNGASLVYRMSAGEEDRELKRENGGFYFYLEKNTTLDMEMCERVVGWNYRSSVFNKGKEEYVCELIVMDDGSIRVLSEIREVE